MAQFAGLMPSFVTFVIAAVPVVFVMIFIKFFGGFFGGIIDMMKSIF